MDTIGHGAIIRQSFAIAAAQSGEQKPLGLMISIKKKDLPGKKQSPGGDPARQEKKERVKMKSSSKKEFVGTRKSIHQAQIALEAAYSALKRTVNFETTEKSKQKTPEMLKNRVFQARRRVRREYQRAIHAYEEHVRRERPLSRKEIEVAQ